MFPGKLCFNCITLHVYANIKYTTSFIENKQPIKRFNKFMKLFTAKSLQFAKSVTAGGRYLFITWVNFQNLGQSYYSSTYVRSALFNFEFF